jgi:hypothetical protein
VSEGIPFTLKDGSQILLEREGVQEDGKVVLAKRGIYVESQKVEKILENVEQDDKISFEVREREVNTENLDVVLIAAKVA